MKLKLFGSNTGLRVSELILGAANLGARRGNGAPANEIFEILSAYSDAGGNCIDVADQYQFGESEENVGRFFEGQRHNFVICSKYTRSSEALPMPANSGNHRKAMRQAVEGSLRRLKTDYIDIYMPHFDDGITPPEEISRGLEDLVRSGKVLYTGLANFPAWKAALIATDIPLTALQIEYNLAQRTAERELLSMANNFGLGTMFYSPMAGGLLTGKYRKGEQGRLSNMPNTGNQENAEIKNLIDELESIANDIEASPGQVAIAWTLTKTGFPILGARSVSQLMENINAVHLNLSADQLNRLDAVSAPELGYPQDLLKTVQTFYL